nr:hypothetical protein [Phytoactinopolyspora alkaliphila]
MARTGSGGSGLCFILVGEKGMRDDVLHDLLVIEPYQGAVQQTQIDVGTDVIDTPPVSSPLAAHREGVDAITPRCRTLHRQVQTVDVCRTVVVSCADNAPALDSPLVPLFRPLRVDSQRRALDRVDQFADQHPGRTGKKVGTYLRGLIIGEIRGPLAQRRSPRLIQVPGIQGFGHHR